MNLVFLSNYLPTKKDRIPSQVCLVLQYSTVQTLLYCDPPPPPPEDIIIIIHQHPVRPIDIRDTFPLRFGFDRARSGGSHQKDQQHGNDLPAILLGMCLAIGACIPNPYLITLLVYYLIVPTILQCRYWLVDHDADADDADADDEDNALSRFVYGFTRDPLISQVTCGYILARRWRKG